MYRMTVSNHAFQLFSVYINFMFQCSVPTDLLKHLLPVKCSSLGMCSILSKGSWLPNRSDRLSVGCQCSCSQSPLRTESALCLKMYLSERQHQRQTEVSCVMLHFPKGHNSQGWASPNPGACSFIQLSHGFAWIWGPRYSDHLALLSWNGGRAAVTQTAHI